MINNPNGTVGWGLSRNEWNIPRSSTNKEFSVSSARLPQNLNLSLQRPETDLNPFPNFSDRYSLLLSRIMLNSSATVVGIGGLPLGQ